MKQADNYTAPGLSVLRPSPLSLPQGLSLLSDLHIGAADVDYDLIQEELSQAYNNSDRILFNGDIFDFNLPGDKYFNPVACHPRLRGCTDIINKAVDLGFEILSPFASQIDVISIGNHDCHDELTEVLTDKGWKLFKDVSDGDQLATLDKKHDTICWQVPQMVSYHYSGPMYYCKNRFFDFCVTPNHRFLNKKTFKHISWDLNEIQNICSSVGRKIFPVAGMSGNEDFDVTDDQLLLLGWMLTDGCIYKEGKTVVIYQREEKAHLVTNLLDRMGADYSIYKRQRNITHIQGRRLLKPPKTSFDIRIKNGPVRDWIRSVLTPEKLLPSWTTRLSDRQFDLLLSTIIEGDGTRYERCDAVMLYGKKAFLDEFQALCCTHGYRSSIKEYRNHAGSQCWRLNINKGTLRQISSHQQQITKIPYDGMVYCATVWNDTLITRRNGKILISGNCRAEKHSVDAVLLLVNQLNCQLKAKGSTHKILYGNYASFVSYKVLGSKKPFSLFLNHGWGAGSGAGGALADLNKVLQTVEGVDLIWLGHRHLKVSTHVQRISPSASGDAPVVRDIRFVRTGSYMEAANGQSQNSLKTQSRASHYSVEKGLSHFGHGGARILLTPLNKSYDLKVIQ